MTRSRPRASSARNAPRDRTRGRHAAKRAETRQYAGRVRERDSLRRRNAEYRLRFVQTDSRCVRGRCGSHRRRTSRTTCASAANSTTRSREAAACSSAASRKSANELRGSVDLQAGDRIASLVSLTLTPLYIESVTRVDVETGRVWIRGKAILVRVRPVGETARRISTTTSRSAVLDVAGAPAQVRRMTKPGMTVVVIGADGKSGMLACAQAKIAGRSARAASSAIAPDARHRGAQLLLSGRPGRRVRRSRRARRARPSPKRWPTSRPDLPTWSSTA